MKFSQIRPFVRYARYMTLSKNEGYAPMRPCDARLFFTLDGEGVIEADGSEYTMKKGSVLLMGAGTEYWLKSPENHVSYIALNFDYTQARADVKIPVPPVPASRFNENDIIERTSFSDAPELSKTVFLDGMHGLSGRLAAIEREYSMNVLFHEIKISALLCEVLCDILRHIRAESALGGGGKLDTIIWYIHEHYREPLTNEALGEYFGFHKNYISEMIKEYTGMPLHRYLCRVRVSHAVDMLNDSDTPIGEIARLCGFCDIYYFSRYFKSVIGVSPSEYRKQH